MTQGMWMETDSKIIKWDLEAAAPVLSCWKLELIRGEGVGTFRKTSMPGVLDMLTIHGVALRDLSAAQVLCSVPCLCHRYSRPFCVYTWGRSWFHSDSHKPFCSISKMPWMQHRDHISHDMDRQFSMPAKAQVRQRMWEVIH